MSHKAVREFIRDTALMVRDDINFYYARESNFNVLPGKQYPAVLLKPLRHEPDRTATAMGRMYKCTIIFYKLDSKEGDEFETQEILDATDVTLNQFQILINRRVMNEDSNELLNSEIVSLTNESVEPRIKFTAENLTGWEYNFNLLVPDQFTYCPLYT